MNQLGECFYTFDTVSHRMIKKAIYNLAGNSDYQQKIEELKAYLPTTNSTRDTLSSYSFQPIFLEQKARTSGIDEGPVEVIGVSRILYIC